MDKPDIVGIIEEHGTSLRRAGRSLRGLCPFHEEKTPSFNVDPVKQVFHCFGCGASGDVITFVMKLRGLDFKAALRHLGMNGNGRTLQDTRAGEKRNLLNSGSSG